MKWIKLIVVFSLLFVSACGGNDKASVAPVASNLVTSPGTYVAPYLGSSTGNDSGHIDIDMTCGATSPIKGIFTFSSASPISNCFVNSYKPDGTRFRSCSLSAFSLQGSDVNGLITVDIPIDVMVKGTHSYTITISDSQGSSSNQLIGTLIVE